jgi:DNA processing protein
MIQNLFPYSVATENFAARAISPNRELGAYEALWSREGAGFKSLADIFRTHAGAAPFDFVSNPDIEKYARLALDAIHDAGPAHFGVCLHGAGECPQKLRDAEHLLNCSTSKTSGI